MANATKKSGSTRIATAKIEKIAAKLGLTVETKAGWKLMYVEGAKSSRLLVHTGKRGTNCVELVGFESEFAVAHPCSPAKTMTQLIDFNVDEAIVLRNIFKTAKLLVEAAKVAEPVAETPAVEAVEAPAELKAEIAAEVAVG